MNAVAVHVFSARVLYLFLIREVLKSVSRRTIYSHQASEKTQMHKQENFFFAKPFTTKKARLNKMSIFIGCSVRTSFSYITYFSILFVTTYTCI